MKKVFSLFFLILLLSLTINKTNDSYPVFSENSKEYSIYKIGTINNSVNINNFYDLFKDVSILGIYVEGNYYKFKNYDLKKNIDEFMDYFKNQMNESGNSIDEINISSVNVYATKSEISKLLKNNILYLD